LIGLNGEANTAAAAVELARSMRFSAWPIAMIVY
jgi:hypothetical protein